MTTTLKNKFTKHDAEIISKETIFEGFYKAIRYQLKHKLFKGGMSEVYWREGFGKGDAAAVLLYDPKTDQVVLQEQFRAGAIDDSETPWLFEIVAGMIEENETPEEVAMREALEETGCAIKELIPIISYYTTPGGCFEKIHLFCGHVDISSVNKHGGLAEEHEDILVHVVDRETAYQAVCDGSIRNGVAIIALQWLQLQVVNTCYPAT